MARTTADAGIAILQGRAVGGTTVVNWTTSFRTPEDVVERWRSKHGVKGFAYGDLVPHYDLIEKRLSIAQVSYGSMNPNNRTLYDGCKKLGWQVDTLRRNVYAVHAERLLPSRLPGQREALDARHDDPRRHRRRREAPLPRARRSPGDGRRRDHEAPRHPARRRGPPAHRQGHHREGEALRCERRRAQLAGAAAPFGARQRRSRRHAHVPSSCWSGPARSTTRRSSRSTAHRRAAASHHFAHRGDEVGFFMEGRRLVSRGRCYRGTRLRQGPRGSG